MNIFNTNSSTLNTTNTDTDNTYIEKTKNKNKNEDKPDYKKLYKVLGWGLISISFGIVMSSILIYVSKIHESGLLLTTTLNAFCDKSLKDTDFDLFNDDNNTCIEYDNKVVNINLSTNYSEESTKWEKISKFISNFFNLTIKSDNLKDCCSTKVFFNNNNKPIYNPLDKIKEDLIYTHSKVSDENNNINNSYTFFQTAIKNDNDKDNDTLYEPITGLFEGYKYYFYNVYASSIARTFIIFNSIFKFINENIPENTLRISYVFISSFIILFLILINIIITWYNCIIKLPYLFYSKFNFSNKDINPENDIAVWKQTINFYTIIRFFILAFMGFFVILIQFFISIFITIIPLFISGEVVNNKGDNILDEDNNNIIYNFGLSFLSMFKYHRLIILIVFIIYFFSDVTAILGNKFVIPFFITIFLLLFFTDIFTPKNMCNEPTFTNFSENIFKPPPPPPPAKSSTKPPPPPPKSSTIVSESEKENINIINYKDNSYINIENNKYIKDCIEDLIKNTQIQQILKDNNIDININEIKSLKFKWIKQKYFDILNEYCKNNTEIRSNQYFENNNEIIEPLKEIINNTKNGINNEIDNYINRDYINIKDIDPYIIDCINALKSYNEDFLKDIIGNKNIDINDFKTNISKEWINKDYLIILQNICNNNENINDEEIDKNIKDEEELNMLRKRLESLGGKNKSIRHNKNNKKRNTTYKIRDINYYKNLQVCKNI